MRELCGRRWVCGDLFLGEAAPLTLVRLACRAMGRFCVQMPGRYVRERADEDSAKWTTLTDPRSIRCRISVYWSRYTEQSSRRDLGREEKTQKGSGYATISGPLVL